MSLDKVSFDGPNKLITVVSGVTELDVESEIYTHWKLWVLNSGGSMYDAAFRVSGGDPILGNQSVPTYYFLINGWKLVITDLNLVITTNLYSDDYLSPFVLNNSSLIVKNSDMPCISSINDTLTAMTNIMIDMSADINNIDNNVYNMALNIENIENALTGITETLKLILGLSQNNYRLTGHLYNENDKLEYVKISLYDNSDLSGVPFATYEMNATYDTSGCLLIDYKVTRLS